MRTTGGGLPKEDVTLDGLSLRILAVAHPGVAVQAPMDSEAAMKVLPMPSKKGYQLLSSSKIMSKCKLVDF